MTMTAQRLFILLLILAVVGVLLSRDVGASPRDDSLRQHLLEMQKSGQQIGIVQPGGDALMGDIKEVGADYVCQALDHDYVLCVTFDNLLFTADSTP